MTIGKDELAEIVRYLDAESEEHTSLEAMLHRRDLDPAGVAYIANQRALRAAMIIDGQDPTRLSRSEFTPVRLSLGTRNLIPSLAGAWLDGLAAGMEAQRRLS